MYLPGYDWCSSILKRISATTGMTGWPLVGNEGMESYMVMMGMKLPSFPTKGQPDDCFIFFSHIPKDHSLSRSAPYWHSCVHVTSEAQTIFQQRLEHHLCQTWCSFKLLHKMVGFGSSFQTPLYTICGWFRDLSSKVRSKYSFLKHTSRSMLSWTHCS